MKRFVLADGAKEQICKIFEKEGIQKKEVAERLGISPSGLCNKIRGVNSSFSERELETLLYTFPEIREAWFKQSYRYGDHVTAKSVTPTEIEVKRISNGYEAQFTGIDGKLHSAYGKTEEANCFVPYIRFVGNEKLWRRYFQKEIEKVENDMGFKIQHSDEYIGE